MNAGRVFGFVIDDKVCLVDVAPALAESLFFTSQFEVEDPASSAPDRHGYQRSADEKRFPEIARYFKTLGNEHLITPVILSVRISDPTGIAKFVRLFQEGEAAAIKRAFGASVVSVVDGQHRLAGLIQATKLDPRFEPRIPAAIYFGLTFAEEAELFNTINVTQRKLPKALTEINRADITRVGNSTIEQRISRITTQLCRDDDSVWGMVNGKSRINLTGMRDPDRSVTFEGLRRSTSNMFPAELLERLEAISPDLPISLAKRYWRGVADACPKAWSGQPDSRTIPDPESGEGRVTPIEYRLKDLVGVASLAKLGKDILLAHLESAVKDRMSKLVSRLSDVDWEKRPGNLWMASQAGFAGQKDLYRLLYRWVFLEKPPLNEDSTSG